VLNDRLANDVRRNGTHSSGTDDGRVLLALVGAGGKFAIKQGWCDVPIWNCVFSTYQCFSHKRLQIDSLLFLLPGKLFMLLFVFRTFYLCQNLF